ncbi:TssA family type VI secretion system protein [Ectothiorhodospira sp. PHS-1]|uniref:TssA family type VI secretion system protein n=1 Tax=Ectothiorhodospira sp. PHS-1 TaxID=519989 RepID=UPI0009FE60BE|nr:TssA family type VI secretion system protein [Ectothiorhodospira sp. PHS-1]
MNPAPLPTQLMTRLEDAVAPGRMTCDEDPRFTDGFVAIKEAFEQLQGTDFDHLIETCTDFLRCQAKDLRIVGYLFLALVTRHGHAGLAAGLRLYRDMVRNHWEHCHPRPPTRRRAAVAWLDNERLEGLLEAQTVGPDPREADVLAATLEDLVQALTTQDPEGAAEAPPCGVLRRWMDRCQARIRQDPAVQATKVTSGDRAEGSSARTESMTADSSSADPDAWLEGIRGFHDHLLAEGELLQACALAQAVRWGSLGLPPARQGVTRIPPPRAESWAGLERLIRADDWEAAFQCGAECFFEPGFHLALDLQHRLARAADGMGRPELAIHLRESVRLLLKRLPGLEALSFEDKRPFMDETTRRWLSASPAATSALQVPSGSPDAPDPSASTTMPSRLSPDMDWDSLNRLPTRNLQDRWRLGLLRSDLCLRQGRRDVAHDLLVNLYRQLDEIHVLDWDPGIATALLERLHGTAVALDPDLARTCARRLCAVDPARAMALPAIEPA